jgi:hypothetical protein
MYLEDEDKTCRCHVGIGTKGSGKSYGILSTIQYALIHNLYDRYTLIIPAWSNEQKGSYKWLTAYEDIIDVYEDYSPAISDTVVKQSELVAKTGPNKGKPIRQCYVLDDSTSFLREACFSDLSLNAIITKSRHLRISLHIILHGMKNIISPVMRANCDTVWIYKITNRKAVEGIWEEYFSMMPEFFHFKDFAAYYTKNVLDQEHDGIFLKCLSREYVLISSLQFIKDYNPDFIRPGHVKKAPHPKHSSTTPSASGNASTTVRPPTASAARAIRLPPQKISRHMTYKQLMCDNSESE